MSMTSPSKSSQSWRVVSGSELQQHKAVPFDSLSECNDMAPTAAAAAQQHAGTDAGEATGGGGVKSSQAPSPMQAGASGSTEQAPASSSPSTLLSAFTSLSLQPPSTSLLPDHPHQAERHLPEGVLRIITSYLTQDPFPMFSLLAMAGTCRQFRTVTKDLHPNFSLPFDSLDNVYSSQPMVQRFRKLPTSTKQTVFEAASALFTGYTDVAFNGDGVTDLVLQRAACRAGPTLARLRLQNSSVVTEHGLRPLLQAAAELQHLHLEELPHICSGHFFLDLFNTCTQLQSLHLAGLPDLSWDCVYQAAAQPPSLGHSAPRLGPGCQGTLTKLHVRSVNLDSGFRAVLAKLPQLQDLEIDGPACNLTAASMSCTQLQRVSYLVLSRQYVAEAVVALAALPLLKTLELVVKNFTLCAEQLRMIGALPLLELRLDSWVYKQQPTLSRSSYSHVENEGVKSLVDAICTRCSTSAADMQPLKLSLCGATALTHDAVSALLRLPVLTELDIGGCCRIIAMDKMRLVAKVRAGREMLESGRRPSLRSSRFPGLYL